MNSFTVAACCGLVLAAAASLAQAQNPKTAVPRADRNMTGLVTLAEYQASRETFIMRADVNRDGKVSRAEWDGFAKAVREDLELGGVEGAERIGQGPWWTQLDANKDDFVTRAEIKRTTAAKFAGYDTNKDLLISRAEAEQVRKSAQAALR